MQIDNPEIRNDARSLKAAKLIKFNSLPQFPQVAIRILNLMADRNLNIKKIAEFIETDQGIASKVLKIASSAYYGMGGKITSIRHAAIVLGYKILGEIVITAGAKDILDRKLRGYSYGSLDLWNHSLAVAYGSKFIVNKENPSLINATYTAGLIHDVGKIILDELILNKKEEIKSFMEKESKTLLDAENHFFNFNHAEIAFELCRQWNFPEFISTAIKDHHQPSYSSGNKLSYVLHTADHIARMIRMGYDNDDILCEIKEETRKFLGLRQQDISKIALKIKEGAYKIFY
jgi:putative nucleotidyltransferase with HDIG domain